MRSPRLCAYFNYLQTPASEYLPQQKPHCPTPGGNSQNICLPRQTHKKICLLVALPHGEIIRDNFQSTGQRKVRSIQPCLQIVGIDKLKQKPGLIPPAPKISILPISQISKPVLNVLTTDMRNPWTTPSMLEILQALESRYQNPPIITC